MNDCKHSPTTSQGIQLTHAESLEHFLECIPEEDRLTYWSAMRADALTGQDCRQSEHQAKLEERFRLVRTQQTRIRRAREILEGSDG